jgi:hypothetical protein
MEFEITYEIQRKDFARANKSLFRATDRTRLGMWAILTSAAMLLLLPWLYRECDPDWTFPAIVVPLAAYLVYIASLWVSPYLAGLVHYSKDYLDGKKFTVRFSAEEVRISGEHVTWIHQWPSFRYIRESNEQFLFYDGMTMYIFCKRYFTPSQKEVVRELIKTHAMEGRWWLTTST